MSPKTSPKSEPNAQPIDPDIALRRLVYVMLLGCVLIFGYGFSHSRSDFFGVVSVGLMAAGAAVLTGGLLGFLFGVPHTRELETGSQDVEKPSNQMSAAEGLADRRSQIGAISYRPNTSLEQVSDWLTKIIVGVGLVEFREIASRFGALARYLARGLGGGEQPQALAATLLVYFGVSGFVFGFLWARLYLRRWFTEADDVRKLTEKLSRLEEQQQADAHALALTLRQLNRSPYDPVASEQEIAAAIKGASSPIRAQIFNRAAETSADTKAANYQERTDAVVSILNALIASDDGGSRYHTNHAELSYVLRRKKPSQLDDAVKAISKAIEIRDSLRLKGWKFYEFHRARCRILGDAGFNRKAPSDASVVPDIVTDLSAAFSDTKNWPRWFADIPSVNEWMALNKVDAGVLRKPDKPSQ